MKPSKPPRTEPDATRADATRADDLQTQLEALLDTVWRQEAEWRFEDHIDLAVRLHRER